jgi:hypothetical protein
VFPGRRKRSRPRRTSTSPDRARGDDRSATTLLIISHLLDRHKLVQFGEKLVIDDQAETVVDRLSGDVGVVGAPRPRVPGIFRPLPQDRANSGSLSYPTHPSSVAEDSGRGRYNFRTRTFRRMRPAARVYGLPREKRLRQSGDERGEGDEPHDPQKIHGRK